LGLQLIEPKGWLCCGSTSAHRTDPEAAYRLPMQNLSLIEQLGFKEVTMPCAACFNRHKTAQHEYRQKAQSHATENDSRPVPYRDTVRVNSLLETMLEHVGEAQVQVKTQKPLRGLRVVCYYGCLLSRPSQVTQAAHPENPMEMDRLMEAVGAEVLDWSYKTRCCGASHSLSRPEIVLTLSRRLIEHARESGAEAIVVACPLCHANLDARQGQMTLEEPMPVLYFTQLMALALGLEPKAAALEKNLVDPRPLLRSKGLIQ
jgi:heterodisulfide reductase subunit B